jgi:CRP/FNR family transcriptional regulator, cyclic AMP receptor protein
MTARDGKTVILKIASQRAVVGLSAAVTSRPSPVTVTTLGPCQIKFVEEERFLKLLQEPAAALNCAIELSREVQRTFDDVHGLLRARSSTEKLVRLLLSWAGTGSGNRNLRLNSEHTHEETAQMIGSSRETVTRLLGDLKKRELIRSEGPTLVIPDRIALQAIAS